MFLKKLIMKTTEKVATLQLVEIFTSIQGESSLAGLPTTFIRCAQCNLCCAWCDTTYSHGKGTCYAIDDILQQVDEHYAKHICITGGEPLFQKNTLLLIDKLCEKGYIVSLETNGSISTHAVNPKALIILDIKCPSSKNTDKMCWSNLLHLQEHDEVKFVIADRNDYEMAKQVCQKYDLYTRTKKPLFSPVYGKIEYSDLVDWILKDRLSVRFNLQIHKCIWHHTAKGV